MTRPISLIAGVVGLLVAAGIGYYSYRKAMKASKQAGKYTHKKTFKKLPKEVRGLAKAATKQNLFVKCERSLERSRHSAHKRYMDWVKNLKVGPTGKERHVYGIYKITGLKECKKYINEAAEIKVDVKALEDLQKTLEVYLAEMEKMVKLAEQMQQYYKDEDYKDDKFAKAKVFHKHYMELWHKVLPMVKKFHTTVDKVEDEIAQRKLDYFKKKYGKKVRYLMTKTRALAKRFVIAVVRLEQDAAKVEGLLKDLTATQKALSDHVKNNEEDIKKNLYGERNWTALRTLKELVQNSRELVTLGKKYVRELRDAAGDPKKFEKFKKKAFHWAHGSGKKVRDKYNRGIAALRLSTPW